MILLGETDNMCGGYTGEHEQMNIKKIHLVETVKEDNKIQKIYAFPNGYGASVIKGEHTYGGPQDKWEIAPWTNDTNEFIGQSIFGWGDDVKGYLNDPEVDRILKHIAELEVTDA